ncbi:hypothetical protein GCM10014713_02050 [Streptomyces purpureus]|uniref:DUF6777 domain-containing protein n=1 Tax=Streptomyces purpureus TaxID=1951 RepID=A0A918LLS9_9ACTN|nr:hypothetical protein GCM10014713_02050 [Streptomyces purpureus]
MFKWRFGERSVCALKGDPAQMGGTTRGGRREILVASSTHRRRTVLAALAAAGTLLAGCGDGGSDAGTAADPDAVTLQPATVPGPDPFTASTVGVPAPPPKTPPPATGAARPDAAPAMRAVSGATPGIYGGTRARGSCDIEKQVRLLAGDTAKAGAFARSAGIGDAAVADWLRGLTPVTLRVDTRVTGHGYRDGAATSYQAVLQAGTAVLVDQYGTPRVRCACGNPLRSPVAVPGAAQGRPWPGYQPGQVVVITPTRAIVNRLVIVNTADNSWMERKTGTGGEADTRPAEDPPCGPDECHLTGPRSPAASPTPDAPRTPESPRRSASPTAPGRSADADSSPGRTPDRSPGRSPDGPDVPPQPPVEPLPEDLLPSEPEEPPYDIPQVPGEIPEGPSTFEG